MPSGGEFELVTMLSVGAGTGNDDRAGHAGALAWVIDGATDLVESPLVGARTDAEWLADFAQAWLRTHAPNLPFDVALSDVLDELSEAAGHAFGQSQRRAPQAAFEHPSAAALIARHRGDHVEWIAVGDCTMLVTRGDDMLRIGTSRDDAGDAWLAETIRRKRAAQSAEAADGGDGARRQAEDGGQGPLRALLMDDLRAARNRMNRPDGYAVLSITAPPRQLVQAGTVAAGPGTRLLMATDGFMRLSDVFARYDDAALVQAVRTRDLPDLLAELRGIEEADRDCMEFPRAKTSDDATAMVLRVV